MYVAGPWGRSSFAREQLQWSTKAVDLEVYFPEAKCVCAVGLGC